MARIARVVVPGCPHHVTQRGNRRQEVFFTDEDYLAYMELMGEWCGKFGTEIWAYCLMPNHVHLILVPPSEEGLRRSVGEAHRRYTRRVNFREGWRGHLWQGRFASFPMDASYVLAAARYIELNPVRAGLVKEAQEYAWSSALAHVNGRDDQLVITRPLLEMVPDWQEFLKSTTDEKVLSRIRQHETTGRPLGGKPFLEALQELLGRKLEPQKRGRKPLKAKK